MKRRSFLGSFGVLSSAMAMRPTWAFGQVPSADETVEKVLVIFKTHLDVGFTDLAATVMKTYFDRFIPGVLSLREQIEREHRPDRYIWTTGAWLVYRYLEEASPENRRRMERAIQAGDFVWHGLPFSVHSELIDRSHFRLGMAFSARLDQRFGRKTIAGKMSDVPGHTRGIVPVMAEAGLELLHIGANTGSAGLSVPPLFVWKSPDGSELSVMYQHDYGSVAVLPGGRTAVSISFTNDNQGPHKPEQIAEIYRGLRERFPRAHVFASDLNALAAEVRLVRPQLPVLTQEIGDTWIYGPASDPLMMARFRELSRLRNEWIAEKKLDANGDVDLAFGKHFLCVPEHTWGTWNTNSHPDVYDMAAFRASRDLPEFRFAEKSWAEKRANIEAAVATLPASLAAEANARLKALIPIPTERRTLQRLDDPGLLRDTKHFRIGFDPKTGAIRFLEHKASSRQWAGGDRLLGLFSHQTFSPEEFERFLDQYVPPKMCRVSWCIEAFGKPGLEKSSSRSALQLSSLKQLWHEKRADGYCFIADLEVPNAGDSGCPRQIRVETLLTDHEPIVKQTLTWLDKPASRLPEALWFSFIPLISPDGRFEMDKIAQSVSPLDVVEGGNRNLHGVISGVSYQDRQGGFQLETLDAFLVSPGRCSLLKFDNQQPDLAGGLHVCLFNNAYGTNFRMWCDDDMQFRFTLRFGGGTS